MKYIAYGMLSWLVLVRHGVGRGLGSRLRLLVLRAGAWARPRPRPRPRHRVLWLCWSAGAARPASLLSLSSVGWPERPERGRTELSSRVRLSESGRRRSTRRSGATTGTRPDRYTGGDICHGVESVTCRCELTLGRKDILETDLFSPPLSNLACARYVISSKRDF